ncbi:MAG: LysR family transcriptional regulator [Burkholderiales bacterium RIFCSPHIGHO2_12_FULL_61_11]|nr:MAG: LysR family transcriptional regulator [Burkholderiales bacterium RIFCSPHIGHO2_12_FULL_61_11]
MNLRHMEVFRAVMATGGVGGAAELLHISQPAVSKLLAQAARHSGLTLFDHVKGRLVATPEARQLYEEVENLWRGVERVRGVSKALARPQSGSLRLAVSASLSTYLVPKAVALLYDELPHLQVNVETLVPSIMTDTLLDQSSHLGIGLLPNEHPNLVVVRSYRCGLACVMPKGHPLAARKRIGAADLKGHRVISAPASTAYGQALLGAYGPHAGSLRLELEARSSLSACLFACAGAGVAVVDAAAVAGGVFAELVVRPFSSQQKLDVCIIRNRYRPMSVIEAAFSDAFDVVWKSAM